MALLTTIVFIVLAGTGVFFAGLGCFLGFSPVITGVINEQIKGQTRLEKGSEQYERWKELPFPLQFNVYIFNVTNPDDVVDNGAKPRVQEVGPFVYKQYFKKKNIEYKDENDTLTYNQFMRLEFDKEKSPYSEEHVFTVLNLPLQGVFQNEEEGVLPASIQTMGVNMLWSQAFPNDGIFVNITPKQLFFEGQQFCAFKKKKEDEGFILNLLDKVADLSKKMFCDQVKEATASNPTIISDDERIRFSFFAHKNKHSDGTYEISAGQKDINTLGQILHWQSSNHMNIWNDSHSICNAIQGTDSAIYAPFNNDSSIFHVYNTDLCKTVILKTQGHTSFKGISGIKAVMDIENFSNDGELSCYCVKKTRNLDGELECFPNGLVDMYNCLKAPVIVSFPHLMWADQRYKDTVDGLEPDESKHLTFAVLEPITGTPLQGRKRVQFNAIIRPIEAISITENLRPALVPVIWVEEIFDLPDDLVIVLKQGFFDKMSMLDVVTYTMIGAGTLCIVVGVGFFFFPMF